VCENGYGKRTDVDEYRLQGRGGQGIINIRTTERNGMVVTVKVVRDSDELMMITTNGMVVRTAVNELRTIGRATQGVRVIGLRAGDKLVSCARVVVEEGGNGAAKATGADTAAGPDEADESTETEVED
jgi:DNA gyrase subunit A